ncbi:MAG: hypothetical protein IJI54_02640 [Kiritimatiellae bacterium]|nr:hypothetical protein [Kiritimatiellia bacterium]
MNVDMTKSYAFTLCNTDGGTTITVEKSRYDAESFNAELETEYRSRIGFEKWGDIKVDNKVDYNIWDDTVNHSQPRIRTTPAQHPYNEQQSRTTPVLVQDPNETDYQPTRKRLNHRGPLSIDVSSAWYFITICADGHVPWIADEVKIGRAVAPRPTSIKSMEGKRSVT